MDIDQQMAKVCERMKAIRIEKGMTQEDFDVEEGGISTRHLRAIETMEKPNVELATLLRFCRLAKIQPKELFNFEVPWK